MPFTPFHIGAGLIVKPTTNHNFSLLSFGLAQIAMDIEPMVGILRDADVLHGPSHTLVGALVIAILVAWLSPPLCNAILRRCNREVAHHKLEWLREPDVVSKSAVWAGALFGTISHVVLDSLMHHDIKPLAPFSDVNPLLDLVSHDGVYQLCVVIGLLGGSTWLCRKWRARPATSDSGFDSAE